MTPQQSTCRKCEEIYYYTPDHLEHRCSEYVCHACCASQKTYHQMVDRLEKIKNEKIDFDRIWWIDSKNNLNNDIKIKNEKLDLKNE